MASTAQTGVHAMEHALFFTLLQLAIIVLAARGGGALARRLGQSAVVGEIIVGITLGPTIFGALHPQGFAWVFQSTPPMTLNILSQIGLLLLMFQIGLEFDFSHLRGSHNRRTVSAVAAAGLAVPFALGWLYATVVPERLTGTTNHWGFTLFLATAFSITAMPVLGRILIELKLTKGPLGVIAISAAAINDVVGWLLLALVTALATSAFAPLRFGLNVLGVIAFLAACWWLVRPPLAGYVRRQTAGLEPGAALPATLMSVVIAGIFISGMTTYQLGIFAIFGGFMMGVMLHAEHRFERAWQAQVGSLVNVFFLPIFFTYTGLRTDVGSLDSVTAWLFCALLVTLATVGKYGACTLAARWSGMAPVPARMIGMMMNTRGLMELIVINVGYDLGVIGREMFTMLVLMALFSTVITTPLLRRWLPRVDEATLGAAATAASTSAAPR